LRIKFSKCPYIFWSPGGCKFISKIMKICECLLINVYWKSDPNKCTLAGTCKHFNACWCDAPANKQQRKPVLAAKCVPLIRYYRPTIWEFLPISVLVQDSTKIKSIRRVSNCRGVGHDVIIIVWRIRYVHSAIGILGKPY